jgi:hypothetical protein
MKVNRTAGLGLVLVAAGLTTACQPTLFQYGGTAYGTTAKAAGLVNSSPSFVAQLSCDVQPAVSSNQGAGVNLNPLGTVGAITSRASSTHTGDTYKATGEEKIGAVSLLGGMITADALHLSSVTTHDASGYHVAGSTQFVNLKVNNTPVGGTVPANTVIAIPGVASVILNKQTPSSSANSAGYQVVALQVNTTINVPNFPALANVSVGVASSGLLGPVVGRVGGIAYTTNLNVGNLLGSGPLAEAGMGCSGTGGKVLSTSTAAVSIPNVANVGATTNYVRGVDNSTNAAVDTASHVAGVDLFGGIISASAIRAGAHTTLSNGRHLYSDAGSSLLGLHVQGLPNIGDGTSIKPNTTFVIPGVGTLYLHRVIRSGNTIEVRMIELVLSVARGGQPVGADIKVGVASALIV